MAGEEIPMLHEDPLDDGTCARSCFWSGRKDSLFLQFTEWVLNGVPSGKLTYLWNIAMLLMGKSTISVHFQ